MYRLSAAKALSVRERQKERDGRGREGGGWGGRDGVAEVGGKGRTKGGMGGRERKIELEREEGRELCLFLMPRSGVLHRRHASHSTPSFATSFA